MSVKDSEVFVIQRINGQYLAGRGEYWTDSFLSAEQFPYNERGMFYAREAQKKEVGVFCRPVVLAKGLTVDEMAEIVAPRLREIALTKLTAEEKRALGLVDAY
jgi:hypothetical protein